MKQIWMMIAATGLLTDALLATEFHVAAHPVGKRDGSRAHPFDLETVFSGDGRIAAGDTIWLHDGVYQKVPPEQMFVCRLNGRASQPILIRRFPGDRVILQSAVQVLGNHVWFRDIEFTYPGDSEFRSGGIMLYGHSNRCINLIVHDCGHVALSHWYKGPENETEFYGNIVWANGARHPSRPGDGWVGSWYMQNDQGTVRLENNISFRWMLFGMKPYSASNAPTDGFQILGNIIFDNCTADLLAWNSPQNLNVQGNFFYHRKGFTPRISIDIRGAETTATVKDNYIINSAGNRVAFRVEGRNITNENNTVFGQFYGDRIGRNTQLPERSDSENKIVVLPNRYEKGRAHVAVYNWTGEEKVAVDLSAVLSPGDFYIIRDIQNLFGPTVQTGKYDGGLVEIPMTQTEVAQPRMVKHPEKRRFVPTAPEFGVFLVQLADSPALVIVE